MQVTVSPGAFKVIVVPPLKLEGVITTLLEPPVDTLIITLTEFGRKIEQNGGNGTEHGYGTAVLIMGGLVKKAQVYSDWPGLNRKNLFEGQDLNSTTDARSIYCSAMAMVFETDFEKLQRQVFWNNKLLNLQDKLFRL